VKAADDGTTAASGIPGAAATPGAAVASGDGDDSGALRAVDGRVPGRRGLATRQRLLEHTRALLETTSYRDLKVVDIAREAGTSPATFYQYFPDAEAALLALADGLIGEGGERLTRPIREATWEGRSAYEACELISESFLEFWADHSSLMAVIDLAALEGDPRFRGARTQLLSRFTLAASDLISSQQELGNVPEDLDPIATAVVLVSMLAHVAAHQEGLDQAGVRRDQVLRALSRMIFTGVTGQPPPN
jgi:AcrR family transcriptional regulator